MRYYADRHHRRSTRYPGFDYASANAYFVTICTHARLSLFGEIVNGESILNDLGMIAQTFWEAIPDHHPSSLLDAYVIMPNHVHGIILIGAIPDADPVVGAMHASPSWRMRLSDIADGSPRLPGQSGDEIESPGQGPRAMHASPLRSQSPARPHGARSRSLGSIVGSFKSAVTKQVNDYWGTPSSPIWQRNYHDRIIRSDSELDRIRAYIDVNPASWLRDDNHPENIPVPPASLCQQEPVH